MLIGLVRQDFRTSRTIGARGIKTWRAFGAPSHFHNYNILLREKSNPSNYQFLELP